MDLDLLMEVSFTRQSARKRHQKAADVE